MDTNTAPDFKVLQGPGADAKRVAAPAAPPAPVVTSHRRRRRWVIAFVVIAALSAAAVEMWRVSQAVPPVRYSTATVGLGSVTRAVTASGSVNPVVTIQVGTYVSGVIQELQCDYNTQVSKGQLCAKIDPRPYQTIVDQEQANLSTAKAQLTKDQTNLAYARLSYDRAVQLGTQGLVTQDSVDSAKSTFDQATAQTEFDAASIQQRAAVLNAAEINLSYTNITSPVDGTVVSRNVTMGQTVAASFQTPTLFLVATDLTKMQVDANVSESDIGGIAIGNKATFTVEAFPHRVFSGEVTQVRQAPQTVQNVVTYDVVIDVANPELLLKPGMTATVRLITDERDNVVRVPDQALRYAPSGQGQAHGATHVWLLRNGRPEAVPITAGLDDDSHVEIVRGDVKPGDQVVTGEQAGGDGSATPRPPMFRL